MLKKFYRLFLKSELFKIMTLIKCQQSPKLKTVKIRITIGILLYFDSGKGWSTAAVTVSATRK